MLQAALWVCHVYLSCRCVLAVLIASDRALSLRCIAVLCVCWLNPKSETQNPEQVVTALALSLYVQLSCRCVLADLVASARTAGMWPKVSHRIQLFFSKQHLTI